jgi:hypothetical protein
MAAYWFKRKRYGWGWTPVTWQGWGVVVVLIVAVVVAAFALGQDPSTGALVAYFVFVTLAVGCVILLSVTKGPRPRWRWGRSSEDDPREDF